MSSSNYNLQDFYCKICGGCHHIEEKEAYKQKFACKICGNYHEIPNICEICGTYSCGSKSYYVRRGFILSGHDPACSIFVKNPEEWRKEHEERMKSVPICEACGEKHFVDTCFYCNKKVCLRTCNFRDCKYH